MGRRDQFNVGSAPVPEVAAGAARFRQTMGYTSPEPDYSRAVIPASASRAIGKHYADLPDYDPAAVSSYHAMAEEVGRQFDHMTAPRSKGGMGISVHVSDEDPYSIEGDRPPIMHQLRSDVENHGRMSVLSTRSTGSHPVFTDDQNDMFRAVHDTFGHLGSGRAIDMHGEDAAYQKHAGMFSPQARGALATETRGQNSALHLTGTFQDQKIAILPRKYHRPGNLSPLQFGEMHQAAHDAVAENRKFGIT